MAEAIYVAFETIGAAIGTEMTLTAGELMFAAKLTATIASVATMREVQRRQQASMRDQYNASLRDRYVMIRSAIEPRRVVLGRQRVAGPLAYVGSYGENRQNLVFAMPLAAHEIDAVEAIYFDDELVELDGSGNVLGVNRRDLFTITTATATFTLSSKPIAGSVVAYADYGTTRVNLSSSVSGSNVSVSGATAGSTGTVTIKYRPDPSPFTTSKAQATTVSISLNGSGNGSVTLPSVPFGGSVSVVHEEYVSDQTNWTDLTPYATVSGSTVTVTGAPKTGVTATVSYQAGSGVTKARVRWHLGAAGQTADAGMVSALPGIWTTDHKMTGMAYLVLEAEYDPDAFPSGMPNVSAVIRGAKLYDPRTSLTEWSENPALMMRYVALSPLLGRQSSAQVNDTSVSAAANVCDQTVNYVVNGQTYSRKLYTAGATLKSGTRSKDSLDDFAIAMAGRWAFIDGQLRIKAGAYSTPLQTLNETWLHNSGAIQVQPRAHRGDVFNVVTGKIADERRDYVVLDFPRVASSSYITEDGAELPLDMQLNAVTFSGQAQQVVAAAMRDARQGLRVTLTCNMRAYPVEVFDTINVTLSRFGWTNKPFEVLDVAWSLDGGIQLTLKETSSTIWALGTSFADSDPAPNTAFASPWQVPAVAGLTLESGTDHLLKQADGTIQTRMLAAWTAIADELVANGGGVEIRYGLATAAESEWQSVMATNGQAQVYLTGLQDEALYLVKARAFNGLVRGEWTSTILHRVVGKTAAPTNPAGLAGVMNDTGILWTWTQCPDADYSHTEVRVGGAGWSDATTVFVGAASSYMLPVNAAGTFTLRIKHVDTSGNASASAASASVTVTGGQLAIAVAGTTATWSGVSGAGKPEDNATVGATAANFSATVGGNNLVANSGFEQRVTGNQPSGWGVYNGGSIAYTLMDAAGRLGGKAFALRADASTTSTFGAYTTESVVHSPVTGGVRGGWKANRTYTVSYWAKKVNGTGMSYMGFGWNTAPSSVTPVLNPALTTDWQRYVFRVTWGASVPTAHELYLTVSGVNTGSFSSNSIVSNDQIHIDEVKVEEGDVATTWSPSREDLIGLGNPVTSSNASTYVGSGAVGTTQIASDAATETQQDTSASGSFTNNSTSIVDQLVNELSYTNNTGASVVVQIEHDIYHTMTAMTGSGGYTYAYFYTSNGDTVYPTTVTALNAERHDSRVIQAVVADGASITSRLYVSAVRNGASSVTAQWRDAVSRLTVVKR